MNRDNTSAHDATILPPATSATAAAVSVDREAPRRRWGLMPPFVPGADAAETLPGPDPEPMPSEAGTSAEPWSSAPEPTAAEPAGPAARSWPQPPVGPMADEPWTPQQQVQAEPWAEAPASGPDALELGAVDSRTRTDVLPDTPGDATGAIPAASAPAGSVDQSAAPGGVTPRSAWDEEWEPWLATPAPAPDAAPMPPAGAAKEEVGSQEPGVRDATAVPLEPWLPAVAEPLDPWMPAVAEPPAGSPGAGEGADPWAEAAAAGPDPDAAAGYASSEAEPWVAPPEEDRPVAEHWDDARDMAEPWAAEPTQQDGHGEAAEDLSPADFPWMPTEEPPEVDNGPYGAGAADAGGEAFTPTGALPHSFFADSFFSPGTMESIDAADEQHADRIRAELVAERLDDLSRQIRERGFSALVGSLDTDQLSRVLAAVVAGYVAGRE